MDLTTLVQILNKVSLTLLWQLVKEKENFQSKSAVDLERDQLGYFCSRHTTWHATWFGCGDFCHDQIRLEDHWNSKRFWYIFGLYIKQLYFLLAPKVRVQDLVRKSMLWMLIFQTGRLSLSLLKISIIFQTLLSISPSYLAFCHTKLDLVIILFFILRKNSNKTRSVSMGLSVWQLSFQLLDTFMLYQVECIYWFVVSLLSFL